jgi:hypothetical protein
MAIVLGKPFGGTTNDRAVFTLMDLISLSACAAAGVPVARLSSAVRIMPGAEMGDARPFFWSAGYVMHGHVSPDLHPSDAVAGIGPWSENILERL